MRYFPLLLLSFFMVACNLRPNTAASTPIPTPTLAATVTLPNTPTPFPRPTAFVPRDAATADPTLPAWTVLVYMAADNNGPRRFVEPERDGSRAQQPRCRWWFS
ncbi:MAG: hypothetical protein IPL28_06365 [Chloroflexi bacterium]|nr:hypothetical protein [Chloroflexota bacterium]